MKKPKISYEAKLISSFFALIAFYFYLIALAIDNDALVVMCIFAIFLFGVSFQYEQIIKRKLDETRRRLQLESATMQERKKFFEEDDPLALRRTFQRKDKAK